MNDTSLGSFAPARKFAFYEIKSRDEYSVVEELRHLRYFRKKIHLLFVSPWDKRSGYLLSSLKAHYGEFKPVYSDSITDLVKDGSENKLVFVVNSWDTPEIFAMRDVPVLLDTVPSLLVLKKGGRVIREDYYSFLLDQFFSGETFNSLREFFSE